MGDDEVDPERLIEALDLCHDGRLDEAYEILCRELCATGRMMFATAYGLAMAITAAANVESVITTDEDHGTFMVALLAAAKRDDMEGAALLWRQGTAGTREAMVLSLFRTAAGMMKR